MDSAENITYFRERIEDLSAEITMLAALLDSDIDEIIFEIIEEQMERTRLHSSSGDAVSCSGRPSFDIPAESIEHLPLCGLKVRQIADLYGVSEKTITRRMSQFDIREPSPIVEAIMNGNDEFLRNKLKSGENLLEKNEDGWVPLHECAYYGQLKCLKLLIKAYPGTIDVRTMNEETALYLATNRNHVDCVQLLLESGAEPDIANKARVTPIYKACERQNAEILKMLVKYNGDVNHRCNQGWTALHEAVSRNDLEIIEILVQAGAKIAVTNIYGISPLFVAAQSGQLDALKFLIGHGADVNSQASDKATALYEACKNGHEHIVEYLLSENADANIPGKNGLLPIHIAAQCGHKEIVCMLIPVTSRARIRRSGISPLHLAAERNRDETLEELIEAGYDVNSTLSFERSRMYEDRRSTPLYFAVSNNNIYATEVLLKAGAHPNVDLINPLLIAIRQGCIKSMKLLLAHGANINAYIPAVPSTFPATIMFSMQYLSLLKFLLDQGCDALSCFTCEYGSGEHPPLPDISPREDFPQRNTKPKFVQFCEMVSTPKITRWAGPIIDLLLDYVGNVQLCSRLTEHLDSYEDWAVIKEKSKPPRSLLHLCRIKIRETLGNERLKRLNRLQIPSRLIRYLEYNYSNDC
ncbi:ASB2 protein, partial [Polypterus senegalus]